MIIREAQEKDFDEINSLVKEVHDLHFENRPDVYNESEAPLDKEYFKGILNEEKSKLYVVQLNDSEELVAYAIVNIMEPRSIDILKVNKFLYIDDFMVKATYRRNGIGEKLFSHIINYGKDLGINSIHLNVWEFNKEAISFYEKLGMSTRNRRMELSI